MHKYFDQLAEFANVTLDHLHVSERCGQLPPGLFHPQPDVWSGLPQKPIQDPWIVGSRVLPNEKQPRVIAHKKFVNAKVLEVAAHVVSSA